MKNVMKLAIATIALLGLSGCAVTGGVTPAASSKSEFDGAVYKGQTTVINEKSITGEEYRVFNQGSTGFTSNAANREDAEYRATSFCKNKDRDYRLLRETVSTPPYILGNFPRVELIFECAPPKAKAVGVDDKYNDLARLKKLLDDGVITQQEFQREKDKILVR
jgi:hypothetical protein